MTDDGPTAPSKAKRANVEMQCPEDGNESEVCFIVSNPDGTPLKGQQIIEAVAEAVLLLWDNYDPLEPRQEQDYDS